MFPNSNFSILDPVYRVKRFQIQYPHQRIKVFLTHKIVSKLSELWSGMFIPDPGSGSWFFAHPDPGVKKAPDSGSRIRIRNTGYRRGWQSMFGQEVPIKKAGLRARITLMRIRIQLLRIRIRI
jgi:hypothetical protein